MKPKLLLFFLLTSVIGFTSCEETKKKEKERAKMEQMKAEKKAEMQAEEKRMEMESNSIAAKAMTIDSLNIFVSALKNAELARTFTEDEGPFTVFAPTNKAFEQVGEETLDMLMKAENRDKLSSVLKYHVVNNEVTAQDLSQMIGDNDGEVTVSTLNGGKLKVRIEGDNIVIKDENGNNATITATDIEASNGMVHIIDAVVMKKS